MKKNFFKKLALVMALTVTVTSVPANNAAAAKAPAFKSSKVTLNVGQTKKLNTANASKYSVSFKVGNKSVATIAKSGKAVKVTGVAAGKTTVKATFKSYATKKTTTSKVAVTVKEEALAIASAEIKGVKTIVVNFNKAVDTAKATVAVKKGSAAPSISATKWAEDAKSVTITMGSKISEGKYDVSVSGLTEAPLTKSLDAKDEAITSIEIVGTNLVADAADSSKATIAFKTLNQYGERMSISTPNVTSSFGTAAVTTDCTASKTGVITVTGIPTTLQVLTTSGSITVVDTTKGVNATATVTYSAPATAKTMTIAGLYNTSKEKFMDMTKNDNVTDYVVLAEVTDQYGNAINAAGLTGKVNENLVAGGGVTGVNKVGTVTTWTDKTVDGKDYVALQLTGGKATTGTFYFTFVNPNAGLLANTSFDVKAGTVIKTLSISANDTLYEDQDNELFFEAVDTEGNTVTKYDDLKGLVTFSKPGEVKFVKKSDGTAKLVYKPDNTLDAIYKPGKKNHTIGTFVAYVNENTSTSYQVKSLTFTVYQKRVATEVTGLKTGTSTAIATNGTLELKLKNIIVEDQYSNVMSESEVNALTNINIAVADGKNLKSDVTVFAAKGKAVLTAGAVKEDADVKLGVGNTTDCTISFSTVDASKATNLKIASVNDGKTVNAADKTPGLSVDDIEVTGTVAGKTVTIPTTQYVVSGNNGTSLSTTNKANTTEKGAVEVTVDTADGPVVLTAEYTYSNASAALTTLDASSTEKLTAGTITAAELKTLFDMKDQYGVAYSGAGVKYELVDITGDGKEDTRKITHNSTNNVSVTATAGTKYTVTASKGTLTKTVTFDVVAPAAE